MKIEKIYFDMDGVIADFDRGVKEILGLEPVDQEHSTEEKDDKLFAEMAKEEHFYAKLEPIPKSLEMFAEVYKKYGDKCEILTGIPKPRRNVKNAGEDKIEWIHERLGEEIVVNIVLRKDKPLFCKGKECILIDDFKKNIKEWEDTGGTGILFRSVEETMAELQKKEMED